MVNVINVLKNQSFLFTKTINQLNSVFYNTYAALMSGLFFQAAKSEAGSLPDMSPSLFGSDQSDIAYDLYINTKEAANHLGLSVIDFFSHIESPVVDNVNYISLFFDFVTQITLIIFRVPFCVYDMIEIGFQTIQESPFGLLFNVFVFLSAVLWITQPHLSGSVLLKVIKNVFFQSLNSIYDIIKHTIVLWGGLFSYFTTKFGTMLKNVLAKLFGFFYEFLDKFPLFHTLKNFFLGIFGFIKGIISSIFFAVTTVASFLSNFFVFVFFSDYLTFLERLKKIKIHFLGTFQGIEKLAEEDLAVFTLINGSVITELENNCIEHLSQELQSHRNFVSFLTGATRLSEEQKEAFSNDASGFIIRIKADLAQRAAQLEESLAQKTQILDNIEDGAKKLDISDLPQAAKSFLEGLRHGFFLPEVTQITAPINTEAPRSVSAASNTTSISSDTLLDECSLHFDRLLGLGEQAVLAPTPSQSAEILVNQALTLARYLTEEMNRGNTNITAETFECLGGGFALTGKLFAANWAREATQLSSSATVDQSFTSFNALINSTIEATLVKEAVRISSEASTAANIVTSTQGRGFIGENPTIEAAQDYLTDVAPVILNVFKRL